MLVKGIYKNNCIHLKEKIDMEDNTMVFVEIKHKNQPIEIREWNITKSDYYDLNPIKARNLMVKCFTYAHLEEAYEKKDKRLTYNDFETVQKGLIAEVKLGFNEMKADFNNPTKNSLLKVLIHLAGKQINRGASSSIIESHRQQLTSVINALD